MPRTTTTPVPRDGNDLGREPMTAMLTPSVTDWPQASDIVPVTHDTYRDIHKAIRAELFGVTLQAGSLDPADRFGREALAAHVNWVMDILVDHAGHEDGY